ncbi:hypothetical protein ACP2W0_10235 [Pseudobacillus badius]|uniref:hypothetical protein n=1 Tax=Bacillus badius TaxID=1455 RepID=UPI0007B0AE7C|nr:hypothetical protein [Bacillus badius]KZO01244.1 hypothetical protein A4244_13340 [Bacillus badius]OCS89422.1 hypothetical protein A6M11_13360 [Bacillus badius]
MDQLIKITGSMLGRPASDYTSSIKPAIKEKSTSLPQAFDLFIFKQASLYDCPLVVHSVDWNRRRADSGGISGTGETPQALWRRGGSPLAPRKAKRLEWKATEPIHTQYKKDG